MKHPILETVERRRIYLFRHAEAMDFYSKSMGYHSEIPLTERGRKQAAAMGEYLSEINFDIALSSDYLRAIQTAQIILKDKAEMLQECEYMREVADLKDVFRDATSVEDAQKSLVEIFRRIPERFKDKVGEAVFCVEKSLDLLMKKNWSICLIVAHGAFNRIFICHLLGMPVEYMHVFEQDYCCMSILELDVDAKNKKFIRAVLRELNITPYNHAKTDSLLTDMEKMAIGIRPLMEKMFE